jgi:hypothetical protein
MTGRVLKRSYSELDWKKSMIDKYIRPILIWLKVKFLTTVVWYTVPMRSWIKQKIEIFNIFIRLRQKGYVYPKTSEICSRYLRMSIYKTRRRLWDKYKLTV